ncbi:MAG: hypothetical protein ACXVA4_10590, partial [Ktedonobacterales bacterium]
MSQAARPSASPKYTRETYRLYHRSTGITICRTTPYTRVPACPRPDVPKHRQPGSQRQNSIADLQG